MRISDWSSDVCSSDLGDEGMLPVRPNRPFSDLAPSFDYKVWTTQFDEVIAAGELCDAEELQRLRAYLDQQLVHQIGRASCRARVCQVRVDLGGRRIITKKKRHTQDHNKQEKEQ